MTLPGKHCPTCTCNEGKSYDLRILQDGSVALTWPSHPKIRGQKYRVTQTGVPGQGTWRKTDSGYECRLPDGRTTLICEVSQ